MRPLALEEEVTRLGRSARFVAAGLLCWSVLIGGVLALISIKDSEAAAARAPLPSPSVSLSAHSRYMWSHFPNFHDVIPILAYHGVNDENNYLSVTRRRFAEQMLALKTAGFHTVTMGQYAHYAATGDTSDLPQNPILLTFDDGRLDSYQGADATLERFGFTATIFVVASFPEERPGWALHWSELARMAKSGRWDVQEHAGTGHHHIVVDAAGDRGEYYAYRRWRQGKLESYPAYRRRVSHDVEWGEQMLAEKIPGYKPLAFAVPYSNYGQRATNDERIPRYMFNFLHAHFPVLIDGDYLDEGKERKHEIKGRGGHEISYRITQGPVESLPVLSCRLRDFVLRVPLWREYACTQGGGGEKRYDYSE